MGLSSFVSLKDYHLFFELLRGSIDGGGFLSHKPSTDDWQKLFDVAENQSVLGVCMAGLEAFNNQGQRPPKELLLKWIGIAQQIEQRNKTVNRHCLELQKKLYDARLKYCMLKGQGNAQMYIEKNPQLSFLRQPGDIDVWVDGGFDKVLQYVQEVSPTEEVNEQHVHFNIFDDTEVEVHYIPSRLSNPMYNRRLKRWFVEEAERQMNHRVPFVDREIVMPTTDFNLVYQMLHIYRHLFSEGVGLRQLMDYYVMLTTCSLSHEERRYVLYYVNQFGLDSFAKALMWVLAFIFHLDESVMLWKPDERRGYFLLSEVLQMGNFGHGDNRFKLNAEDSHIKRYLKTVKSKFRFIKYFPSETLWQPINFFWTFFEIRRVRREARKLMVHG